MFDRNLMKLDGMPRIMGLLVVLALAQAAATIGQAVFLARAIAMLWAGTGLDAALPCMMGFFGCFAAFQALRFAQETLLDRFSLTSAVGLRAKVLESTFGGHEPLGPRVGAAAVATAAGQGIDDVQAYIRIIPPKAVGMMAISLPLLAAAFAVDWVSGIILAAMFPVIIFFMVLLGRQAAARAERQYAAYTRLSNRFVDTLRGLTAVKAFGASRRESDGVFRYSERLRTATVRTLTTATLSSAVLDLCATLGVAAVAMMLAFRLMDGSIELAGALTALILAPEYFSPIRAFASDYHASLDGRNALASVFAMIGGEAPGVSGGERGGNGDDREGLQEPSAGKGAAGTQSLREANGEGGEGAAEQDGPAIAWGPSSVLELRDVGFVHDDGTVALPQMTFTLRGFEKVALIGPSGAGKTTLADIVAGFKAPTSGQVLLDDAPFDLCSRAWRSTVRYIPQSPYVFRATLRDNVRFYAPDADDEAVLAAIGAVGLAPLLDELPDGLDTVIGEGARGLSGGQAHRIALARMLLDDARVLVFDEPTAHLDIETELELKERMLPLMEGRLVVFATHRLHWVADMDRAVSLVRDNGAMAHADGGQAAPRAAQEGGR